MVWWIPAAHAEPAADIASTCAPLRVEGTLPKNGDLEVPPDVMPVVVHNNGCGSVPRPTLYNDETDLPLVITLVEPSATVVRIVPDELLLTGTSYRIDVPETSQQFFFTVGAAPTPAPAEAEVGGVFDVGCGALTTLTVELTATFPDADPAQRGLAYMVTHVVDGGIESRSAPRVYDGQSSLSFSATLVGGRQVCASLVFEDLTGAVTWETEEVCGEEFVCPAEDDLAAESGCGCRTGGAGGLALLPLVLFGLRRRR